MDLGLCQVDKNQPALEVKARIFLACEPFFLSGVSELGCGTAPPFWTLTGLHPERLIKD